MPDLNVRSETVNVEQIMEQIRNRIREKRGADYSEEEIRDLATARLEKLLDPRGVRSDLLEQFRRAQLSATAFEYPNFAFEEETLFDSTRGLLRFIRRLLQPILKLFFNPNPLIQALNIQSKLNASIAEREAKRDAARLAFDQLQYDAMHNLVIETTRLGIEARHLAMRVESLSTRLEFNERRTRAIESTVVYGPPDEAAPRPDVPRPPRRDEGRRDEGRRDEGRRVEGRRDEGRPDDARRDDVRRDDSRREDSRRQEARRVEQQARPLPPVPLSSPQASEIVPDATEASPSAPQAQPAGGAETGGQKARRRRRRRGRRGGGAASVSAGQEAGGAESASDIDPADGDEGDAGSEAPAAAFDQETEANTDSRTARPVPFEHTFGAQTHPAETATSDPTHTGTTQGQGRGEALSTAPTPDDPSVTPEQ